MLTAFRGGKSNEAAVGTVLEEMHAKFKKKHVSL